jgi:hypothetical protein
MLRGSIASHKFRIALDMMLKLKKNKPGKTDSNENDGLHNNRKNI